MYRSSLLGFLSRKGEQAMTFGLEATINTLIGLAQVGISLATLYLTWYCRRQCKIKRISCPVPIPENFAANLILWAVIPPEHRSDVCNTRIAWARQERESVLYNYLELQLRQPLATPVWSLPNRPMLNEQSHSSPTPPTSSADRPDHHPSSQPARVL